MPTASARGAAFTDCQYVAIAGIWVQAWPPLTLFFLFLGQAKSRTAPQVPGYVFGTDWLIAATPERLRSPS
jgi:hypothetical protein